MKENAQRFGTCSPVYKQLSVGSAIKLFFKFLHCSCLTPKIKKSDNRKMSCDSVNVLIKLTDAFLRSCILQHSLSANCITG